MAYETTPQCRFCSAPIGFYRGHRGNWLPSNLDGTPHRCKEYFAARKGGRKGLAAAGPIFDVDFADISDISLPSRRPPELKPSQPEIEHFVPPSLDVSNSEEPVGVASAQWKALPDEHLRLLLWFHQRSGTIVTYGELESPFFDEVVPAGSILVTRAKGIYKPRGSDYALSVRQTLGSPYADQEPDVRPDGSWVYMYHQEEPRNVADPATFYTNRSLARNMADRVPVGVLIQEKPKPDTTYLVLGLAFVERWENGFFRLRGIRKIASSQGQVLDRRARPVERILDAPGTNGGVSVQTSEAVKEPDAAEETAALEQDPDAVSESMSPASRSLSHGARVVKNRQVVTVARAAKRQSTKWTDGEQDPLEGQIGRSVIALPGPSTPSEPTVNSKMLTPTREEGSDTLPDVIPLPASTAPLEAAQVYTNAASRRVEAPTILEQSPFKREDPTTTTPSLVPSHSAESQSVSQLRADSSTDTLLIGSSSPATETPMSSRSHRLARRRAAAQQAARQRARAWQIARWVAFFVLVFVLIILAV